jgi:hypothetical protein
MPVVGWVERVKTLVAQLVKRLADPKPDSNVAAGGPSPGPGQGLRGGAAGAGARPDAHIRRGIRLMLHSGEASFVPWVPAYTEASRRGGWLTRPEHQGPVGRVAATSSAFQLHPIQGAQDEIRNHRIRSRDVHESIVLGTVG